MLKLWLPALGLISLLMPPLRAASGSAQDMVSKCRQFKKTMPRDSDKAFDAGYCAGAMTVVMRDVIIQLENPPFCFPRGFTVSQFIVVFSDYVRANPKLWNEPYYEVAIASGKQVLPCSGTP